MTDVLLRPLADAFMQVGVFVALLVAPFGWAQLRWGDRVETTLRSHARLAPLVAAALTLPPGCGGAIIVVALYARGALGFGAVVAALVATTGDAAWVLLATDPLLTVQLKVLLLVTGAVTGWCVDALGLAPRRVHELHPPSSRPAAPASPAPSARPGDLGTAIALVERAPATPLLGVGVLPVALWSVLGLGATVSVPVTFQVLAADSAYLGLGLVGALVSLAVVAHGRWALADDHEEQPTSMREVLRHGGHEVAFVTTWVAVAYVVWALVQRLTGLDPAQLPLVGLAGVLVGALVGLIPGCAIQIVFAGTFAAGGMPLSTFVANTISQDGDALLPLLALERRSALVATLVTVVPALVVGTALLLLS